MIACGQAFFYDIPQDVAMAPLREIEIIDVQRNDYYNKNAQVKEKWNQFKNLNYANRKIAEHDPIFALNYKFMQLTDHTTKRISFLAKNRISGKYVVYYLFLIGHVKNKDQLIDILDTYQYKCLKGFVYYKNILNEILAVAMELHPFITLRNFTSHYIMAESIFCFFFYQLVNLFEGINNQGIFINLPAYSDLLIGSDLTCMILNFTYSIKLSDIFPKERTVIDTSLNLEISTKELTSYVSFFTIDYKKIDIYKLSACLFHMLFKQYPPESGIDYRDKILLKQCTLKKLPVKIEDFFKKTLTTEITQIPDYDYLKNTAMYKAGKLLFDEFVVSNPFKKKSVENFTKFFINGMYSRNQQVVKILNN